MNDNLTPSDTKAYKELIPRSIIKIRELIETSKMISVYLEVLENHDGLHEQAIQEKCMPYTPESPRPPKNFELEEVLHILEELLENDKRRLEKIIHILYGAF